VLIADVAKYSISPVSAMYPSLIIAHTIPPAQLDTKISPSTVQMGALRITIRTIPEKRAPRAFK
jgi:hypothetical protein